MILFSFHTTLINKKIWNWRNTLWRSRHWSFVGRNRRRRLFHRFDVLRLSLMLRNLRRHQRTFLDFFFDFSFVFLQHRLDVVVIGVARLRRDRLSGSRDDRTGRSEKDWNYEILNVLQMSSPYSYLYVMFYSNSKWSRCKLSHKDWNIISKGKQFFFFMKE